MRFRQTSSAWAGSAVWAARHRHRKADTWELLKPVPISPGSRNLEHYDYFQREKYRGKQGPSAFQCRPVRPAGLSKLRTNAFASEHNLPPDAYWDQDNEQTHKKRKINTSSKSKYCSLAWVWGKKNRARMEKHQQHTNQDWNRGEKERPLTSPLAQTKQSPRAIDAQEAKGRRKDHKNDVERRVQKMKSRSGTHKCVRVSPTNDTDQYRLAKTLATQGGRVRFRGVRQSRPPRTQIPPYGLTHAASLKSCAW